MTTTLATSRLLAAVTLVLTLPALVLAESDGRRGRHSQKIDRALEEAVARGGAPQRVIIRTKDANRAAIRRALEAHGDLVSGEQAGDSLITAEVHIEDIRALAASQSVLSVSLDAIVTADAKPVAENTTAATKAAKAKQAAQDKAAQARAGSRAADKKQTNKNKTASPPPSNGPGRVRDSSVELAVRSGSTLRATLGLDGRQNGRGVVVAVVDSGIRPIADFDRRIIGFFDCMSNACVAARPSDEYGHGTHVSGLIAGNRTGVATEAQLVGLKVLDKNGEGRTSGVLNALAWIRRNKDAYNIQVVNLSLGHPIYEKAETDPLVISVQQTAKAGIKVVVAAGNYGINKETKQPGYAGITSPGNAPNAITVGAAQTFGTVTRQDDRVAPYSSRGPTWYDGFLKPDLVAPGDALEGPVPGSSTLKAAIAALDSSKSAIKYNRLSGTSMAAGVTSGVVATVLQANQDAFPSHGLVAHSLGFSFDRQSALSANAVKAILQYTAIPLYDDGGDIYDPLTQGAGGINAGGATSVAGNIDATRQAPEYWLAGWNAHDILGETTIGGATYTWTQNIFWGDNIVWGSGLITHAQVAWEDNIVWGSLSFEDNIVWGSGWGDNIVWGSDFGDDNIVWGSLFDDDNIVWGSSFGDDNIVWGSCADSWCDNIVWGSNFGFDNIVWGSSWGDNIVWSSAGDWLDNIVWGSSLIGLSFGDNIVWGSSWTDNIVWGSSWDDNIVWGSNFGFDNIVWGSLFDDNIVWGSKGGRRDDDDDDDDDEARGASFGDDNIVWSSCDDYWCDNIVWGSNVLIPGAGR